jgi:hypothetical protein
MAMKLSSSGLNRSSTQLKKLIDSGSIEQQTVADVDIGKTESGLTRLLESEVHRSIAAVVRALREVLPTIHGFTLLSDTERRIMSTTTLGSLDPVVLCPRRWEDHSILSVFQQEDATGHPPSAAFVLDSAPWPLTPAQRNELYEHLMNFGQLCVYNPRSKAQESIVPKALAWTPSPHQSHPDHSEYFTVLTAWAILLGLPLNTDFAPSADFYQNANLVLLAV